MKYTIRYWPDPALQTVAQPVTDLEAAKGIIDTLFETMYADRGIGLAAPQCNISLRIFVLDTEFKGQGIKKAFINPEIVETEGTVTYPEGCLSFPNVFIQTERANKVRVKHTLLTGETEEVMLEGLSAIAAQHELDHLNGIVFISYLGEVKRMIAERKIAKEIKKARKRKQK